MKRLWLLLVLSIVLVGISAFQEVPIVHSVIAAQYEQSAFDQINVFRRKKGLRIVKRSDALDAIARFHSKQIALKERAFGHDAFDERSVAVGKLRNPQLFLRCENVYYAYCPDPDETCDYATMSFNGWIISPGHLKNILTTDVTHSGMGVWYSPEGKFYITQVFAKVDNR